DTGAERGPRIDRARRGGSRTPLEDELDLPGRMSRAFRQIVDGISPRTSHGADRSLRVERERRGGSKLDSDDGELLPRYGPTFELALGREATGDTDSELGRPLWRRLSCSSRGEKWDGRGWLAGDHSFGGSGRRGRPVRGAKEKTRKELGSSNVSRSHSYMTVLAVPPPMPLRLT
ncbi:hypothetical protein THAOC_27574, partial [Thalassiosira oceanica]